MRNTIRGCLTVAFVLLGLQSIRACPIWVDFCPNFPTCIRGVRNQPGWQDCSQCTCPVPSQNCFPASASATAGVLQDCGGHALALARAARVPIILPRTLGVDPLVGFRAATVEKVLFASPAFQAGLRRGDQILMVNGTSVAGMSYKQIVRVLDEPPRVKLIVARGAEVLEFSLSSENLVLLSERIRDRRWRETGQHVIDLARLRTGPGASANGAPRRF